MELLNLNSEVKSLTMNASSCCLCCKHSETNVKFEDILEIGDSSILEAIADIVKHMVPSCDFLLLAICGQCHDSMIQLHTIVKTNIWSKQLLIAIIDGIHREQIIIEPRNKYNMKNSIPTGAVPNVEDITQNLFIIDENPKSELDYSNEMADKCNTKCNKCEMAFENETILKKHKQVTHSTLNKALVCAVCGMSFNKPNSLKSHLNSHREKPCPICKKLLKTHSHFQIHVKQHESKQKRNKYRSNYLCEHCNYQSFNKMSLEAHINRIHLNLRPFLCKICDKAFYKKSHLVEHNLKHYNDKQHTCEICGDSFANKKCLDEHLRLHLGEKPYECHMCFDKFVTLSRRNEHVKRKHMDKCEICNVCGKRYSLKKELNRHMKQVHERKECYAETDVILTQLC